MSFFANTGVITDVSKVSSIVAASMKSTPHSVTLHLLLALYVPLLLLFATATFAFAAYLAYVALTVRLLFVLLIPALVLFGTAAHALLMLLRWGFQAPGKNPFEVRLPREEMGGLI